MDQAKRLLSASLIQLKPGVLSWWEKQTTNTTRLPSPHLNAVSSIDLDAGEITAEAQTRRSESETTATSPDYMVPSRERDEHDLLEARLLSPFD